MRDQFHFVKDKKVSLARRGDFSLSLDGTSFSLEANHFLSSFTEIYSFIICSSEWSETETVSWYYL